MVSTIATQEGTQVQFAFSPEVTGLATVVWSQPHTDTEGASSYRLALRFDDIPSLAKAYLENWLEK